MSCSCKGRTVSGCAPEDRVPIYNEVQQIQHDELPYEFTLSANAFHVVNNRVRQLQSGSLVDRLYRGARILLRWLSAAEQRYEKRLAPVAGRLFHRIRGANTTFMLSALRAHCMARSASSSGKRWLMNSCKGKRSCARRSNSMLAP